MDSYQIFQIGPIRLWIEESCLGNYDSFWAWKLDPYRISSIIRLKNKEDYRRPGPYDIIIENSQAENLHQPGSLLFARSMGFFELRTYQTAGGYLHRYVRSSNEKILAEWYESSEMNRYRLLQDNSQTGGSLSFEILGHIIKGSLLDAGILLVHSALVEYQGNGIVISAPSGTGKTTHARIWRDYKNALIINGDLSALYKENDTWYGFGLPWSGSSGEQINRRVPIKAIILLEQAPENTIRQLTGLQAYEPLLANCRYPSALPAQAIKAIDLAAALTQDIPILRLDCRPDTGSVDAILGDGGLPLS